jgi:hypothetical protein
MTKARVCTGRCAMSTDRRRSGARWLTLLVGALLSAAAPAAESPQAPPATAQAGHQVTQPDGLHGRLLRDEPSPVRRLDPAVFTEISPVTASDPAVRLPEDQRTDVPPARLRHDR